MVNSMTQRYSREGLLSLFLMCAFPLHAWTLILVFRDLSWLTDRTNAWDAVGVASYGLVFAFVESLVIFLMAAALGFLISMKWEPGRRIALLTVVVLIVSMWAMVEQLFFLTNASVPGPIIRMLVESRHPLRVLYAGIVVILSSSFLIPVMLVVRSNKVYQFVRGMIERLSLLVMFYLFFDLIGLVIVLVRNI